MHNLGVTRSSQKHNHMLQTPDTFVPTTLPGMKSCVAIVHASPALGAKFTQYTAEFEPTGELGEAPAQRFLYVLEGQLTLELEGRKSDLEVRGYAYLPEGTRHRVRAARASRASVIEKIYQPLASIDPPRHIVSSEDAISSQPLNDDSSLRVKCLLPDSPQFDFAVNTMVYQSGSALSMVEMHIMEHGLLMLEGGGIYRLGDSWYPVTAGDFIWMGPWCPQWFGAIGKVPAKYLIYKDANRHPLALTPQTGTSR
ncbi:MAG TPA: (S)-ureidoglycine aminohydrolase [Candidatus Solibacter sp.]|nr:(S)-ureidoglycine aminohydrolase [Candidatus Solibacter sp.]